jgi:hypothetical protein
MGEVLAGRLRGAPEAVGVDLVPGTEGLILTSELVGGGYETVVVGAGDFDVPDIGVGQRTCPNCLQWQYETRQEAQLGHERVATVILQL